jgi:hypothetical protein
LGRFYLFFIRLVNIFVTVLWQTAIISLWKQSKIMATFTQKLKDRFQSIPVPPNSLSLKQAESTAPANSSEIGGLFVVQDQSLMSVRRLVVLIPNLDIDEAEVAREIWKLAFPPELAVLFLGLCPSINEEPRVRRRLATVAALTRDTKVPVEIRLEFGRNWIGKLETVLEAGDIVVCHAEQRTGIWRQPLELVLSRLNIPILTLKGFIPSMYKSPPTFLRESVFWLASIAILSVFFLLQIQILRISEEWVRDTMLSLSVLIEFGLIWVWSSPSA